MFKIFVSSYLVGENGQTIILEVLRNEKEKQIAALKKKIDNYNAEELKEYENEFLAEIVKTYNTPEAPIPLSDEEIKRQLAKMFGIWTKHFFILPFSIYHELQQKYEYCY